MNKPFSPDQPFILEEATIAELHAAIKAGKTTVTAVVQHYLERVRRYNGVASMLVTRDGADVCRHRARAAAASRSVSAGTVNAADILPPRQSQARRSNGSMAPPPYPSVQQISSWWSHSRAGKLKRSHPEHSWRALGDLQGDFACIPRTALCRGRTAGCEFSVSCPTRWKPRPGSTPIRAQSRPLSDAMTASCSPSGPVRTTDMRSTAARRAFTTSPSPGDHCWSSTGQ